VAAAFPLRGLDNEIRARAELGQYGTDDALRSHLAREVKLGVDWNCRNNFKPKLGDVQVDSIDLAKGKTVRFFGVRYRGGQQRAVFSRGALRAAE